MGAVTVFLKKKKLIVLDELFTTEGQLHRLSKKLKISISHLTLVNRVFHNFIILMLVKWTSAVFQIGHSNLLKKYVFHYKDV